MKTETTQRGQGLPAEPDSELQVVLLRSLAKNHTGRQIAGHRMAKWLSVANALCRRGLAASYRTGSFCVTAEGRKWLAENPAPNTER